MINDTTVLSASVNGALLNISTRRMMTSIATGNKNATASFGIGTVGITPIGYLTGVDVTVLLTAGCEGDTVADGVAVGDTKRRLA